jgi:hypothetical protein
VAGEVLVEHIDPGPSVVDELQRAARAEPDRLAGTVGRLARGLGLKDGNDALFFVQPEYARIGQNALARANATIGVRDNTHMWL